MDGAVISTFEAAWVLVITGLVYVIAGLINRHFRTQSGTRARRTNMARIPRSVRKISAPRAARSSRKPRLQRCPTYRLPVGHLRPFSLWSSGPASPCHRPSIPLFPQPSTCWGAANPPARCISSSPVARVLSRRPRRHDYSRRILESHAGHDHRPYRSRHRSAP